MNIYNTSCGGPIIDERWSLKTTVKRLFGFQSPKTCTLFSMCPSCRAKRSKMCGDYHLYKNIGKMNVTLRYYFKNISSDPALLNTMYTLGVGAVERDMRSYYEKLYITRLDDNHKYFVDNVLPTTYTYDHDPALNNNNYWKVVLYISILKTHGSEFDKISRGRLSGILCDDYHVNRTVYHKFRQPLKQLSADELFLEFFNLYIENVFNTVLCKKYNNIEKYNLCSCIDIDINKLILTSCCKILFDILQQPVKNLFDIDYIRTQITTNYYFDYNYILTCDMPKALLSISGKVYKKPVYDRSYDFLNLMVDDHVIKNTIVSL